MYKTLGLVQEINGFYNFKPYYDISNGKIQELYDQDLRAILPGSDYLNINLSFSYAEKNTMEATFFDNSLFVVEFDQNDLEDNLNGYGELNPTAYKVNALKLYDEGRINFLEQYGYYYVIPVQNIKTDIESSEIVEIDDPNVEIGQEVFLYYKDGIFIGPYMVRERQYDGKLVVNTGFKKEKYILQGYRESNTNSTNIKNDFYDPSALIRVIDIIDIDDTVKIDMADDNALMEMFVDISGSKTAVDGKLDISDTESILKKFNNSMLSGNLITEEIRKKRLAKIKELITSQIEQEDTVKGISEDLTKITFNLLERYKGTKEGRELFEKFMEQSPELSRSVRNAKEAEKTIITLQDKLKAMREQIAELENENKILAKDIKNEDDVKTADATLVMENKELKKKVENLEGNEALKNEAEEIKKDIDLLTLHKEKLEQGNEELEDRVSNNIDEINQKMYDSVVDGFIANKIAEASAQWMEKKSKGLYEKMANELKTLEFAELDKKQIVEYLYENIHKVRPTYDKNSIINMAICFTQGFLTVLSGVPGCGKTSICNIFADVLGLKKIKKMVDAVDNIDASRFIQVSVERGWTSKRDFIGYFNPLTKTFDKNNKQVYDALHMLDQEIKEDINGMPMYILLDEANLSPMEYYWADFMNLCDGITDSSIVNLGGESIFNVPESLHFMATINNDHTTENLSPRLIDRSWIITLPKNKNFLTVESIDDEDIKLISWKTMDDAFNQKGFYNIEDSSVKQRFEQVAKAFENNNINVSHRTYEAVMKYCNSGIDLFEEDTISRSPETIALDYAISQKLLPKIAGYGEEYEAWLLEIADLFERETYSQSAEIVKDIIAKGNTKMKYYEFFN